MVGLLHFHFKCLPSALIFIFLWTYSRNEVSHFFSWNDSLTWLGCRVKTTRFLASGKSKVKIENHGPYFSNKDSIRIGRISLNLVYKNVKCYCTCENTYFFNYKDKVKTNFNKNAFVFHLLFKKYLFFKYKWILYVKFFKYKGIYVIFIIWVGATVCPHFS